MLTVKNLSVRLPEQQLLSDISCSLPPGRITSFVGPSGAGKTTLLKTIIGLISPHSGNIIIEDMPLTSINNYERSKKIGYLFQDFNLFTHMTVLQNCLDPLAVHGIDPLEGKNRALSFLKKVGMEKFKARYPEQLSGGQKQRVAIARMLALQPTVILLDEPTASLDPHNTDILVSMLKQCSVNGLTIGLATQDMSFITKIFDRVYYLEQGTIIESCDITTNPINQCPALRTFLNLS
jgi:ABC-type polar amino acid transport system ATPase subunit